MNLPKQLTVNWNAPCCVKTLITTRIGGYSTGGFSSLNLATHVGDNLPTVIHNRKILNELLPSTPYWLNQTHSDLVADLDHVILNPDTILPEETSPLNYDAAFTHMPNKICVVMTADCVPILLTNKQANFVAAIHAGWRGLHNGIIANCIRQINTTDIIAYIGPAICAKHYEVGSEIFESFCSLDTCYQRHFVLHGSTAEKYSCDLAGIAKTQLVNLGIRPDNVFGGNNCTYCSHELFYSHRRENPTGRFASLIWLSK